MCNVADLGDAHLEQLAPHCGALRVLGLVWCPQVRAGGERGRERPPALGEQRMVAPGEGRERERERYRLHWVHKV